MTLSRQSIQRLVELIETHLVEEGTPFSLEDVGDLRMCRYELIQEWRRQEQEQFKKRAHLFSRRQKISSRRMMADLP